MAGTVTETHIGIDQHGLDVLQGVGIDRDNAASEEANVVYSSTNVHPVVDECDRLTLKVSGNTSASAEVTIYLTYALGA